MKYTVDELKVKKESQTYERKSARKDPKGLSNHFVAFANADGGTLVIGIEDNYDITGIDAYPEQINEILRVPFDFCKPSVLVESEVVECIDKNGNPNHLLVIEIPQSSNLHSNQQDDVYYRMGDKSQKLSFEDRLRLMYSKGARYYEDEPVANSSIEDIDFDFVSSYCQKIGYTKSPIDYIYQNKSYVITTNARQEMSVAAILLFGKDPQRFFQRARVRFIRYDGIEAKVGGDMNVIKEKIFMGNILNIVKNTLLFLHDQIKEHTYLAQDGKFVTVPEYPEFVWKEIIVNAIVHRDYSIKGTDIQIKMFNDKITVESPGNLPSIVRLNNMRYVHFSRNPKIATFLHEYEYVQEFGEGVDRIYQEMEKAGLPYPEFQDVSFMLNVTIRNGLSSTKSYLANVVDDVISPVVDDKSVADGVINVAVDNENVVDNAINPVVDDKNVADGVINVVVDNENVVDNAINPVVDDKSVADSVMNVVVDNKNVVDDAINPVVDSIKDSVVDNVVDKIKNNIVDTIDLNQTEKDIITILRQKPESSAKEIAAQLNKNQRTIQRHMIALKEKGKLKRVGSDRRGKWIIIE